MSSKSIARLPVDLGGFVTTDTGPAVAPTDVPQFQQTRTQRITFTKFADLSAMEVINLPVFNKPANGQLVTIANGTVSFGAPVPQAPPTAQAFVQVWFYTPAGGTTVLSFDQNALPIIGTPAEQPNDMPLVIPPIAADLAVFKVVTQKSGLGFALPEFNVTFDLIYL